MGATLKLRPVGREATPYPDSAAEGPTVQRLDDNDFGFHCRIPLVTLNLWAFGICVGTSIYALFEAQAGSAVRLLFLTDVVFLAMLCPLYWIQRSMFDETKEEKNRSAIVSGIYLTLVLVAFWFLSRQAF